MTILEAKKWIKMQRSLAAAIWVISALLFACAALKSIHVSMEGGTTALSPLTHGIQRGVYSIYQATQFASMLWEWAPVLNPQVLNTSGNFGFLLIVIAGAIGRMIWASAADLSARIAKTIKKVEELGWEQELRGQRGQITNAKPDVLQINIDLNQKDQWYKRPVGLILLGVAVAVLGQLANLKFGFVKL